jgi:hypothetical protein
MPFNTIEARLILNVNFSIFYFRHLSDALIQSDLHLKMNVDYYYITLIIIY